MRERIFKIKTESDFETLALDIFQSQCRECPPYREYLSLLEKDVESITCIEDIPFLPVRFFKTKSIICGADSAVGGKEIEKIFTSSATTGVTPAKHFVKELSLYEESFIRSFTLFFGEPSQYTILALLPSYLEREGSSLVYMVDRLIQLTKRRESGFYLYNFEELYQTLLSLNVRREKTILFGVSFALLDFTSRYRINFPDLTVIETGGMKGRGTEMPREELHSILKESFGVEQIASEYGMAELLSQAYSLGEGVFYSPPWMEVLIRDLNNPFRMVDEGRKGGINIIDLANIHSCSFLETEDLGMKESDSSIKGGKNGFRIFGRISHSEARGCNMLIE